MNIWNGKALSKTKEISTLKSNKKRKLPKCLKLYHVYCYLIDVGMLEPKGKQRDAKGN